MDFLGLFYVLAVGLTVGSFLNVVIYRWGGRDGWRVWRGRSRCLACGRTLRWFELLPLVSFIIQLGHCRRCRSRLAWQYPAVELATGLLFVGLWLSPLPLPLQIIQALIWSILVVIFVYDFRHQIIPDGLVYSFNFLALLHPLLDAYLDDGRLQIGELWPALAAGLGLAAFFWFLWFISRGRWLGFADGKLALGVGWLAGPSGGLSAIVLAFWLGAALGLLLIAGSRLRRGRKSYTMKSELPFAPFIIIGLALVQFFHLNVLAFF